jgi:CBS domain-containing protein
MNTRIADVLKSKGTVVYDMDADMPVISAVHLMTEKSIGSVLVREHGRVVGILTERDLVRQCTRSQVDLETTPIKNMMTTPLAYVEPTTSVGESLKVMSQTHCRHLPVFDQGELAGIISLGDLLRWTTSELEAHVSYLESYIRGR